MQAHKHSVARGSSDARGSIHETITKGDKVKHMSGSLDAIHFEELFTLGLIHFARYMRLTKGDKVKHMLLSLDAILFGELFILG